MKKIKVNEEACIGCGACVAIDPEHFQFNDNGLSEVISEENLESIEVQNAIESCPTAAIVMKESVGCHCIEDEKCSCENCNCPDDCDCTDNCDCGDECACEGCNCQTQNEEN